MPDWLPRLWRRISWPDFSLPALLNVVSYLTGVKKSGQRIVISEISEGSSDRRERARESHDR